MDPRNIGIGWWVKVATDFDIQDLRKEAERKERRVQYLREDMERTVQQRHLTRTTFGFKRNGDRSSFDCVHCRRNVNVSSGCTGREGSSARSRTDTKPTATIRVISQTICHPLISSKRCGIWMAQPNATHYIPSEHRGTSGYFPYLKMMVPQGSEHYYPQFRDVSSIQKRLKAQERKRQEIVEGFHPDQTSNAPNSS